VSELSWEVPAIIERAKVEILDCVTHLQVPPTVTSFSDLHDHVDANEFGGFTRDDCPFFTESGLDTDKVNAVQDALDAWIKGGALKTTGGLWCPWAEALCGPCHESVLQSEQPSKRPAVTADDEPGTWDRRGLCNRCGAGIWLPSDVALYTRIKARVGGELEQTGGMCAAMSIVATGRYIFMAQGDDGEWWAWACASSEQFHEGFGDEEKAHVVLPDGSTDEEIVAAIERLKAAPLKEA
jgi:hypothetical protein